MLSRIVRVDVRNPRSLCSPFRGHEVSRELRSVDLLALPGTGFRADRHEMVTAQPHDSHWGLRWGVGRGPMLKKSAGVSTLVSRRSRRQHIAGHFFPPRAFRAGGGAR